MDKNYWNCYYKKNKAPQEPSPFAIFVIDELEKGKKLIELGCGNGRDSIYFNSKGIKVTAVDQATSSIDILKENHPNIDFIVDDFVKIDNFSDKSYDYIYSRFSIHSINAEQELIVLKKYYYLLEDKGKILLEARSTKDDFYGRGNQVGKNEFVYEDHYRRFIDKSEIIKNMENIGYKIKLCIEDKGLAKYKDQDPVVIRIIAYK